MNSDPITTVNYTSIWFSLVLNICLRMLEIIEFSQKIVGNSREKS